MKPWTTGDLEVLRYLGPRVGGRETAAALGRPYEAVRKQAQRAGVALRRRDNVPTLSQAPERVLRRIRELATAPLCPACGKRPASVSTTGLCAPCHHETRVALAEEALAAEEALRRRATARQRLHRLRKANAADTAAATCDAAVTMERQGPIDPEEATCNG